MVASQEEDEHEKAPMSKVWIKLPGGAEGWGCECMAKTLPLIEKEMLSRGLIKRGLDVFQWAYNPGEVPQSANTHDLGGVIDVNQYSLEQRKVWAQFGVMMFPRTTQFGWYKGDHGHGVWHGCPHQVPYTDWQVRSGIAGGDGLGSMASLKGRNWRHFEAPQVTWQEALKKIDTRTPLERKLDSMTDEQLQKIIEKAVQNVLWTSPIDPKDKNKNIPAVAKSSWRNNMINIANSLTRIENLLKKDAK